MHFAWVACTFRLRKICIRRYNAIARLGLKIPTARMADGSSTTRIRFFVVRRRCTAVEWTVIMYLWASINHFRSPDCGYRPLAYGLKSYRFLAVPYWPCALRRYRFFLFSSGQSLGIFMCEINGPNSARFPRFRVIWWTPLDTSLIPFSKNMYFVVRMRPFKCNHKPVKRLIKRRVVLLKQCLRNHISLALCHAYYALYFCNILWYSHKN